MKKTFGHRAVVVGLIASLIASPAWAGISATINSPATGSTRRTTSTVNGSGTVTLVGGDHIDNWTWKFGFGTKDANGQFNPELEQTILTQTDTSWVQTLQPKPWNASPTMPPPAPQNPPTYMADHWARVTFTYTRDTNIKVIVENNNHTVKNP